MTFPTYLAHPVITWEPDWQEPVTTLFRRKNRWDGKAGKVRDDTPYEISPRTLRRVRYVFTTRAEIMEALAFIRDTAQGRLNAFWVPEWVDDVFLTAGASSGSTTLSITNIGFTKWFFGAGKGRQHVALFPTGSPGTVVYREVTAAAVVSETAETITLDSAIGVTLAVGDRVCFLLLCRAESDDLVLHRESWDIAILELPLIDVPWDAAVAGDPLVIGPAIETDTALPLTGRKTLAIGLASATDTGLSITAQKRVTLGLPSETDTGLAMTVA